MLDHESPRATSTESSREGNGDPGGGTPPRPDPRAAVQALSDQVTAQVGASTRQTLHQFAAELQDVLSTIRSRLEETSRDLDRQADLARKVPAQLAEGMSAIGEGLGEIATAQTLVGGRLDGIVEEVRGSAAALEEKLRPVADLAGLETRVLDAVDQVAQSVAELASLDGKVREAVDDLRGPLTELREGSLPTAIEELREDVSAVRARLGSGRSRGSAVAADLEALEARVDGLEMAIRDDLVEAVFDRMQQAFDRRFDALVQLVDARLTAPPPPPETAEPDRRTRRFRRS